MHTTYEWLKTRVLIFYHVINKKAASTNHEVAGKKLVIPVTILLYQFRNLRQRNGIGHRHYFRIVAIIYFKSNQGAA